jgi:sucrose-6-phosphate hydrolase SacC (GH32 family)
MTFVWWDGTRWRMLVGASLDDGQGAALQFVATDRDRLVDWRYEGVFFSHAPQALPGGQDTGSGGQFASVGIDKPFSSYRET